MKTRLIAALWLACLLPACAQTHRLTEKQAEEQNKLQRWVLDNVYMWNPWKPETVVAVLGQYQKRPSEKPVWDAYYFPKADMTILVARQANVEMVWRYGRATQ
jgi:hypothetical protein